MKNPYFIFLDFWQGTDKCISHILFTLLPIIPQPFSMAGETTKHIGYFYRIFPWLAPLKKARIDSDTNTWPQTSSADPFADIYYVCLIALCARHLKELRVGRGIQHGYLVEGKAHAGRSLLERIAAACKSGNERITGKAQSTQQGISCIKGKTSWK